MMRDQIKIGKAGTSWWSSSQGLRASNAKGSFNLIKESMKCI